jgi:hypothetical protein
MSRPEAFSDESFDYTGFFEFVHEFVLSCKGKCWSDGRIEER